ncbi:hypothetical protein [Solemya velesiana gill symbiont]|uniref:Uncharacterized protein n=1 Tax=Solemya velesiana gill symbiont TaxID=1918948 RepID=A0A1T2KY00_9GAMM|nr:hypothetical protein [Solemya velesiana gill symbiont]OOZ37596.1 hypothetical protein BOW51_01480 [Solemya velesiana gill symbiont]
MTLLFSTKPGRRERHLLRKRNNPLFQETQRQISTADLQEAQRLDHEELADFITEFRKLVHQAVSLQPSEESEVVLKLKESLDKAYEQACGLADDQTETKDAIKKLVAVIMNAVRSGAENDPVALGELQQESTARDAHFELLEHPLIADILYPESVISEEDLVPTLLSSPPEEFASALTLFDTNQLQLLIEGAESYLGEQAGLSDEIANSASERISVMRSLMDDLLSD